MKFKVLQKSDFNEFVRELTKISKVVAPVSKGYNNFAFDEVSTADEISMEYIPTILPPKKYFMPQEEVVAEYDKPAKKMQGVVDYEKLILLGVHTCDLAGIQCMNMVFDAEPKDFNYNKRKENIIIIGLECNAYCDEHAICAAMDNHNPKGGYDLFMTDLGKKYLIHVNSSDGEAIAGNMSVLKDAANKDIKALEEIRGNKKKTFKKRINVKLDGLKPLFDKSYDSPVWKDLGKKCLSCGNCTNVCPTCYCFDISDVPNLDLATGVRVRKWDSCQAEPFAEVAGDENFREERSSRQRHRYMRKFTYPVEKYNRHFCTGCGRCSRTCMAKISIQDTINELAK